jgi:hypothetical protein
VSSEVRNGAVRIKGGELKITSLKAIAPEEARRRTALRHGAEGSHHDVHRWTGFADAFTHLHTGIPADHSSQKISLARHLQQLGQHQSFFGHRILSRASGLKSCNSTLAAGSDDRLAEPAPDKVRDEPGEIVTGYAVIDTEFAPAWGKGHCRVLSRPVIEPASGTVRVGFGSWAEDSIAL